MSDPLAQFTVGTRVKVSQADSGDAFYGIVAQIDANDTILPLLVDRLDDFGNATHDPAWVAVRHVTVETAPSSNGDAPKESKVPELPADTKSIDVANKLREDLQKALMTAHQLVQRLGDDKPPTQYRPYGACTVCFDDVTMDITTGIWTHVHPPEDDSTHSIPTVVLGTSREI
jgi:hypothetical protein